MLDQTTTDFVDGIRCLRYHLLEDHEVRVEEQQGKGRRIIESIIISISHGILASHVDAVHGGTAGFIDLPNDTPVEKPRLRHEVT
jgi:hypothetical protein